MTQKLLLALAIMPVLLFAQSRPEKYAADITPAALKAKLSVIAGAEMEGRETASPGQRRAATYIENHFKMLGLKPGAAAGYQMPFAIYQDTMLDASLSINGRKLELNKDYTFSMTSLPTHSFAASDVVFASFGMQDSSRSDYKDLEVKNKWLVLIDGSPSQMDAPATTQQPMGRRGFGSGLEKIRLAREKGAKGIIIISKDFPRTSALQLIGNKYTKKPAASIPILNVSMAVGAEILGKNFTAFTDLKNVATGIYKTKIASSAYRFTKLLRSTNVLGVIEGSDKKDEYVFLTGHYDHIGMRNGVIYYGADDDGSGTTAVLQMAEAFAKAKAEGNGPRRTMVFMTVSGEENGLLGSDFYTSNPLYPLKQTTVDLNTDMIGRIDPSYKGDSLNYVFAIGEDKLSSDLQGITDSVNKKYINMEIDRRYNDVKDPNRFYYRSDHYNFAKNGVPIIFYFNGSHADYHRPTDTVDKINFDLMSKRTKLVFHTAWVMANRENLLKRDIPLN